MQKVHLISISEPLIQDLALAMRKRKYEVSASGLGLSDAVLSTLREAGCVCYGEGWFPEKLAKNTSTVVLGATVKEDNPELIQAKKMGLMIQSIPEFIFSRTKSKTRVVAAGSHGKKKILSMVIYALRKQKLDFDYAVSSEIDLLPSRVSFGYEARIALIEGDEHITSALDRKFQLEFYRPQIAVLTSLTWSEATDHSSPEEYISTYKAFVGSIERQGKLIYYGGDKELSRLADGVREDVTSISYDSHDVQEREGVTYLQTRYGEFPVNTHNDEYFLINLSAARWVCRQLGIKDVDFYRSISEYSLSLQA